MGWQLFTAIYYSLRNPTGTNTNTQNLSFEGYLNSISSGSAAQYLVLLWSSEFHLVVRWRLLHLLHQRRKTSVDSQSRRVITCTCEQAGGRVKVLPHLLSGSGWECWCVSLTWNHVASFGLKIKTHTERRRSGQRVPGRVKARGLDRAEFYRKWRKEGLQRDGRRSVSGSGSVSVVNHDSRGKQNKTDWPHLASPPLPCLSSACPCPHRLLSEQSQEIFVERLKINWSLNQWIRKSLFLIYGIDYYFLIITGSPWCEMEATVVPKRQVNCAPWGLICKMIQW